MSGEPDSAERASAPAPLHRRRTDTLSGWSPEHDDDRAEATAWRARRALEKAAALEATAAQHAGALSKLTTSVDGLTGTIGVLVRLLRWAGAIVGALVLGAGVKAGLDWLSTLHH